MNRLVLSGLAWLSVASLHAWNDTGHKVVALVAYERLTPAVRASVDALLAAHPHYEELLKKDLPGGTDVKLWTFLQAATWPDMVRPAVAGKKKPETMTRYHNGSWHYVNIPYVWPSDAEKFAAVRLATGGDLLSAIANCRRLLPDQTRKATDRGGIL